MKNQKNCPICKQNVLSDIETPISCALCGMAMGHDNMILLVKESDPKYFCIHGCYKKYLAINEEA